MIDKGKVIKKASKVFNDAHAAYKDAHADIDSFSGIWVEVTPAPTKKIINR